MEQPQTGPPAASGGTAVGTSPAACAGPSARFRHSPGRPNRVLSPPMEAVPPRPIGEDASGGGLMLLAAVLAAIVFLAPLLLAPDIPLLDPDEGLHASIAQEMVQRGDWLVPRLMGKSFLDKPILYFWAQAAALRLLGMSEAAVLLAGTAAGSAGHDRDRSGGAWMFGRTAGVLAAVLYASMILPVALAQAAAHDVALVVWVTLATLLFWESERTTTRRAALTCILLLGTVLGLAILTKGLAGVALVGVAYGGHLLLARRLTLRACLGGMAALSIGVLIASAWYVAVEFAIRITCTITSSSGI